MLISCSKYSRSYLLHLGSTIYGRVMIDTAQSLGSAYHVVIEKVYLCSGLDGYVPKFDPSVDEFGCLADSKNLLYRFKVLVNTLTIFTNRKFFFNSLVKIIFTF